MQSNDVSGDIHIPDEKNLWFDNCKIVNKSSFRIHHYIQKRFMCMVSMSFNLNLL